MQKNEVKSLIESIKSQTEQLKVNIKDSTNLRQIGIESVNGSMLVPLTTGPIELVYNMVEGTTRDLIVSLDSPSVFGNEEVDVLFSSVNSTIGVSPDDYATDMLQPIRLYWSIGEQTKTIILSALSDTNYFENSLESLNVKLANPSSAIIVSPPLTLPAGVAKFDTAVVYIENNAPQFEYARVYLGPFATQAGRIAVYPDSNVLKPYTSYNTSFGGYNYNENNQFFLYDPNGSNTFSPAFNPGQALNNFNKNKLNINVKNTGVYPIQYNNIILDVGQTMSLTADTLNYFIDLPANMSQTLDSSGNTITSGANYELAMYMSYTGNGPNSIYYYGEFKLKDLSNNLSTNKTIDLGTQIFDTYPQPLFSTPTNSYYLITKFSNINTGRSGVSCPTFGFNLATQENAAVDGFYFIDTYSQTEYIGTEFRQGGGIIPTCSTVYNVPYEIIP